MEELDPCWGLSSLWGFRITSPCQTVRISPPKGE
ncbi:hypothetical protein J2Z18_001823 [Paenibacillus lactis]|uniref:Uncharacterized protein n=2 Tax=Paenibacillus lactis TaxID=228574 RepID=G4HFR4_9BACL|nr:hypothetical protein PaelaDRAFT_2825 [Paenibacillus lactis 154]MBP1892721.1 hypothetical protein [Paenibacillus lactis]